MKSVRDIRENGDRVFRDKSEESYADGTTDCRKQEVLGADSDSDGPDLGSCVDKQNQNARILLRDPT